MRRELYDLSILSSLPSTSYLRTGCGVGDNQFLFEFEFSSIIFQVVKDGI